jgi:hypothetical protein
MRIVNSRQKRQTPVVMATRLGTSVQLVACPYCGKPHLHGAAGHALAHCTDIRSGETRQYQIVIEGE